MNEKDLEKKVDILLKRYSDNFFWDASIESKFTKELKELCMQYGEQGKEADTTPDIGTIKDSDKRLKELREKFQQEEMHQFPTGAKRSSKMPRYDLIPKIALDRLAQRFTGDIINNIPSGGALKYGEGNWEKGLPTSDVINHIINHITSASNHFRIALTQTKDMELVRGSFHAAMQRDDDLAAAMWGLCVLMHQEETAFFHDDSFPHAST